MDDCCAVCAEPLEWVAYGPCGHRDVCSTCVVRLRNVCGDRRCCICKTECNLVFITKALGDYTRTIDFSSLPVDVREGQVFISEQKLYTKAQLNQHISTGDSEVDGTESERGGFMGHPTQNPGQFEYYKNYDDLEIPTSFRYRRPNEPGSRRGRGRGLQFRQDSSPDNQLSMAIQASLETSNANSRSSDPMPSSSNAQHDFTDDDIGLIDPLIPPFESLGVDSQPPSRYLQAVSHSYTSGPIENSSFPPLSAPPNNSHQRPQQNGNGLPQNTMAARLRQKNNKKNVNVVQAWPTASRGPNFPAISSIHPRPMMINTPSVPGSSTNPVTPSVPTSSNYVSSVHARPATSNGPGWGGSSSIKNASSSGKMKHSTSAPKLGESGSFDPVSDFPPVSLAQTQRSGGSSNQPVKAGKVEDVQTANKSLVERMRAALDHDQDKFAAFKDISQEYRLGSIDTFAYFGYIKQFGLLDLVPDLARLCPDPQKQKELLDTYSSALRNNESQDMFWGNDIIQSNEKKNNSKSAKGKKVMDAETSRSKDAIADSVLETVRRLQSSYRHEGEVEVLEKDGYRASKGKSKTTVEEKPVLLSTSNLRAQNEVPSNNGGSSKSSGDGGRGGKKGKKTSKFHRVRLGDGSVGALLDLRNPANDPIQDSADNASDGKGSTPPVRGVWRSGGGQKLISTSKK
ncbi:hypothetical protein V2J09_020151 [Rumex salicifolius]